MPNSMEHEEYRFSYMSQKQLYARLNKITDRQKLINFILCCDKKGYTDLGILSRSRWGVLFSEDLPLPNPLPKKPKPIDIIDKIYTKRKIRLD